MGSRSTWRPVAGRSGDRRYGSGRVEAQRHDEALAASEERFRLLVEAVEDYAIFMLDPGGHVVSWNRGAARLKGYTADEIVGQHFSRFYTGEDRAAGLPAHLLGLALADGRVESEGWRVRKDGTRFWADVVITALHGADGVHRGFAKVTRDLTERRRAEEARRDLAAIVAHDLRSPMSVITGLTGILLDDWEEMDDDRRREFVVRIDTTVTGLRRVVDDVLDIARADAGELTFAIDRFDLVALARRVASELLPVDGTLRIDVAAPGDLPWALGDERRTWQVLSNLVANALRYGEDTPVEVRVDRHGDDRLRVSVTDRGPGLSPEKAAQAFDRFARVGTAGGAGLGLHIARTFVEAQGGAIGVDTAPGEGASFWFTLPV